MAKGHEYCCCAIPLMNVGIYLTILEQFTVSLTAGILSIATPRLVGSSIPSFAQWLVAIGAFILCGAQGMGFFGVFKEKATLFQRYVQINAALVAYIFSVSATWIIISATRHGPATTECIQDFFANNATTVDQANAFADDGQGPTICNIFTWVSVGIMGGLWIIMLIFQGYLLLVCRWYSVSQLADHSKYYSIYSVNPPEGIPLGDRQRGEDAWDPRPSTESWSGGQMSPGVARPGFGAHSRQNSDVNDRAYGVSAADAYAEKKPTYGYRDDPTSHSYPDQAYVNDSEAPTPVALTSPDRRFKGEPDQYDNAQSGTALPPGAMYPSKVKLSISKP
ncbi:hypothetical protein M407DRAFT_3860 [Tulasnella calospora MUT 4182]|uniref:Transmembrane protein n=1 Tax=Tulasnella calospora MUT 4182 TaxID=1051891 RepID=A0A0C3QLZ9_9AGAM|nr:hypothetical protein M407DRAFT_3860 [Tulasnella calospora MUT 4182]